MLFPSLTEFIFSRKSAVRRLTTKKLSSHGCSVSSAWSQLRSRSISMFTFHTTDKLVMLVDKMLALTPKLRAAKGEAERATLQNAVTATDRQIDEAVYALYALTPEEIALVEGGK